MANSYDVGDLAQITAEFTNSVGTYLDPTEIYCSYTDPSGNVTTLHYGVDLTLTRSAVGRYVIAINVDEAGTWYYHWYSTGTGQASESDYFTAKAIPGTPAALAAYSLETARTELKRVAPWLTADVAFAPLEGLADGVNPIFHLPNTPADPDSALSIHNLTTGLTVGGYTVLSYDAGSLRFSSGSIPTSTFYASYTAQAMSNTKLLDLCKAGFDDMQGRWSRPYYLVASSGATYISSSPTAVVDPTCGTGTFSTSRVQIDFLLACCEYTLIKGLMTDLALKNFAYREERLGGLMIDRSRNAGAMQPLLDLADKKAEQKLYAARSAADDTALFGDFIPGAQSDSYVAGYEWWSDSAQAQGL